MNSVVLDDQSESSLLFAKINLLKGLGPDLFVRAMGCPHIWINVILDCTCEVVSG